MSNIILKLRKILLSILFLVTPIFFLNITQEFFYTHKIYLGALLTLLLLTLTIINFIQQKNLRWKKTIFESSYLLLLLSVIASIIIVSPNKVESALNMGVGFLPILVLMSVYVTSNQTIDNEEVKPLRLMMFSSLILGLVSIVFFFNPLKNVQLSPNLNFLKSNLFTPVGSILDTALMLGFFSILGLVEALSNKLQLKNRIFTYLSVGVMIVGLALTIFTLVRPIDQVSRNINSPKQNILDQLTPYSVSWLASIETLKSPVNAFFGVGPGNFISMFTRVRPNVYNLTPQWDVQYGQSRSAILHILTELGVLGLIAFGLFALTIFKLVNRLPTEDKKVYLTGFIILGVYLLLFPLSYMILFLLTAYAISLSLRLKELNIVVEDEKIFNTAKIMPLYFGVIALVLVVVSASSYFLYRSYSAELSFKESLDGAFENNAQKAYDNNRKAIIANPYIERFRVNFSQLNLLIANNLASKEQKDITEQDRQNITQAIQSAISEAKSAVSLNPQRASYWENLAVIYRNILNITEGADAWTLSSYQRAIEQDPSNPVLRLSLGGVYYTLGNFEEASKLFEQSIALKPDWANAYYNYAWAMYQRKEYPRAVTSMQNVLQLVDKTGEDYKRAEKDLEEFKKMIPEEQEIQEEGKATKKGELNLPTPPVATFSPKIELPKEASPGAELP